MSLPARDAAQDTARPQPSDSDLARRLEALNRLLEVTRVLAAEIDLDTVLENIIEQASEALDCERATLYQYDEKTNELYTTAVTELEIGEIRKDVDTGISGYVARNRSIANIPDPAQDARWNSSVDRETGFTTRNILAAPLTSPRDGHLLGVLSLLNKHNGSFDKMDEELIAAFSQHAGVALDRARLVEEIRQNQQLEASLEVARQVQRSFMPGTMPNVPGYELASWWFPQEAVGGDYCDAMLLRDGRLGICVADVSGHGLGPSLIMASVRAALRALLLEHSSADVLMRLLARSLEGDLADRLFITMVLAVCDPTTHEVQFSNAGHAPAMRWSAKERRFTTLEATNMPLGVGDADQYVHGPPFTMHPGDLIFLCTDGIVESMDAKGKMFGQERLEKLIAEQSAAPLETMVQTIGAEVSRFYVGTSPPDDLTMIVLRRNE
jgi:phosphoserine phosphatase